MIFFFFFKSVSAWKKRHTTKLDTFFFTKEMSTNGRGKNI